jgi:HSP20 family protein
MDAYRKDASFLLQLDLPGVKSESIQLTVDENVLTIAAERPSPCADEGVESVIAERTFGTFSRQVVLGKTLDAERIEATYEAGVLTVVIPVAEQAQPRRIEVSVAADERTRVGPDDENPSGAPDHKKLSPFHKKPSVSKV